MSEAPTQPKYDPIDAEDVPSPADDQPLGDICAGCEELTLRLERLERRLAELEYPSREQSFSTLHCYWLCVALHALVAFAGIDDEGLTFGYRFLMGACGTLAVCHVLTTRPVLEKFGRTLLAVIVVSLSMMLSGWISEMMEPIDLLSALSVYLPIMIVSGWLTAKVCVWTRGWRIIPPQGNREFPKLKIGDLMLVTLLAAAAFGAGRWALGDDEVGLAELLNVSLFLSLPVVTSAVISVFLARVQLTQRPTVSFGALAMVMPLALIAVTLVYVLLRGLMTDWGLDDLYQLIWYSLTTTMIGMVSPVFTFSLMRAARYRFAGSAPQNKKGPELSALVPD